MLLRPLIAAALVAAPGSDLPPAPTYFVAYDAVKQVECQQVAGTAFIANHHLISVAHVTNNPGCAVNGEAIQPIEEGALDLSSEPSVPKGLRINCGGFHVGEKYWALGYAYGLHIQRAIPLVGTGEFNELGMAILFGSPTVIPGMSGGPIINEQAEVVGTVNIFYPGHPYSGSQELRGTSLCK
jgi:hypothetical protein